MENYFNKITSAFWIRKTKAQIQQKDYLNMDRCNNHILRKSESIANTGNKT